MSQGIPRKSLNVGQYVEWVYKSVNN